MRTIAAKNSPDAKAWVVGRNEDGPFIGLDGEPTPDLEKAETHPAAVVAKSFASRRTQMGFQGMHWQAMPLAAEPEPDDDEPYSQERADASYRTLSRG